MKIQKKVFTLSLLLLLIFTGYQSKEVQAAYDYTNQSCSIDHGRDIIFIVQDTPEMVKNDPEESRITEVLKLMDQAGDKDRFGLIGFDTKLTKKLGLTTNKLEAKRVLKTLGTHPGTVVGNDLSVGLEKAIQELSSRGNENDKMIVIMTVGTSINNMNLHTLATEAYAEDIKIHTVSFGDSLSVDSGTLRAIVNRTGGNYHHSPNAAYLWNVLSNLNQQVTNFTGREVRSDWKLTQDVNEARGLMLHENVKVDLNGYNLQVDGDLVLLSCSELRAVSGVITAKNIDQKSRSSIRLNNSQLNVTEYLKQDGLVSINGDYKGADVPELKVNEYAQYIHGFLDVKGQSVQIDSQYLQEGRVDLGGGSVHAKGNVHQKGYFNVQQGKLQVDGNLTIDGGLLKDDAFMENKALNVGGGVVQVGSMESMNETRATGNVKQLGGQLFVNHGIVRIYGDYSIADGWLTMIKGSMDTDTSDYGEGDGDFVHVHGNFSMESPRNHAKREYTQLGKPMHDQGHLTDGVLKVGGSFIQKGNREGHSIYTDRAQNYTKDYSRFNFGAAGRHKVVLTGKEKIDVVGTGFTFNLLELHGKRQDYSEVGPVKWNRLIEVDKSANTKLASLSINDIPVLGFNPNVANYFNHVVPANSFTSGVRTLKVDARAQDHLNTKVQVLNSVVATDGTAEVKVLVTAADGVTEFVYTVYVTVGSGSGGRVTSIELDRKELLFTENGEVIDPYLETGFNPQKVTIGYTVYPKTADNQEVSWTSTNEDVATVDPNGIVRPHKFGEATIVATTADGKFIDSATVKVLKQIDLLEGIKTLADLVSDNDRYNKIMSGLYDLSQIGIVVPGGYIDQVTFNMSGNLAIGTITTTSAVERVEVRVNGHQLGANASGIANEFIFTRRGLSVNDYVEVIAYDATSNELERIATTYPVQFTAGSAVSPGFYSLQRLLTDPVTFSVILAEFAPEQLRFTH